MGASYNVVVALACDVREKTLYSAGGPVLEGIARLHNRGLGTRFVVVRFGSIFGFDNELRETNSTQHVTGGPA